MLARSRALVIGLAIVVFVAAVAGFILHGVGGGVLLLAVAALLAGISATRWGEVRSNGRPARILIVAVLAAIGIAKLTGGA